MRSVEFELFVAHRPPSAVFFFFAKKAHLLFFTCGRDKFKKKTERHSSGGSKHTHTQKKRIKTHSYRTHTTPNEQPVVVRALADDEGISVSIDNNNNAQKERGSDDNDERKTSSSTSNFVVVKNERIFRKRSIFFFFFFFFSTTTTREKRRLVFSSKTLRSTRRYSKYRKRKRNFKRQKECGRDARRIGRRAAKENLAI